jgi:hypothetical protein
MSELEPSPNELAAAVETARRLGWKQDEITLAGWITHLAHLAALSASGAGEDASPLDKVRRFEVIDHSGQVANEIGRVLTRYGVKVSLSYQDDGTTLKVFLDPELAGVDPPPPQEP